MAYTFGIKFETLDPDRRDRFLESLLDLIDEHRRGADTVTIKLTFEQITALLDELTEQLSYLPGSHPQDGQNAATLLTYLVIQFHGTPDSKALMNTFHARGVDTREAREVARALKGLALRLGAWLGRVER